MNYFHHIIIQINQKNIFQKSLPLFKKNGKLHPIQQEQIILIVEEVIQQIKKIIFLEEIMKFLML